MTKHSSFRLQDEANGCSESPHDPFALSPQPPSCTSGPQPVPQNVPFPLRPVALAVRFDAIPAELAAQPHWYLWNYRAQGGKWKKPPVQIDGTAASVTDLATSATYALVRDAYNHEPFDGIGVLIEGETVGIDLDHCVASNGDIEPWAAEIAHRFAGTYRERSPSSAGLRIFATGRVPRSGKGGPENRLEVYAEGSPRYLTVTGHRLGVATEVTEQQAALDWLFERYMTAKAATQRAPTHGTVVSWPLAANDARSDADILHCLFAAANGADARHLFDGDTGDDPSAADMAFVCLAGLPYPRIAPNSTGSSARRGCGARSGTSRAGRRPTARAPSTRPSPSSPRPAVAAMEGRQMG